MKQKIYQIDAFAENLFEGNPAAVCILESWPDDHWMQQVAMENNLAETAYLVPNNGSFEIRWFTPELEVDLCGHATLASAYVLFHYGGVNTEKIEFYSPRSGPLSVEKGNDGLLILDFPADDIQTIADYPELSRALGKDPLEIWQGKTDYMLVYKGQEDIESMKPDFLALNKVDARGVIVTAPGREVDFVSRFFAPQSGINEDPVTGSAHTTLIPYWAAKLGKNQLSARQISKRGGRLHCQHLPPRVRIGGNAVLYLIGEINTN
ncbi:MAG: PhzF family phenazine biosynthesis protein [Flavobacteriaceae bacterium]